MGFLDLSDVEVQAAGEFEPIPEGKYLMQIDEAELKDTKTGGGQYIKAKFKVVDNGDYANRVVFHNFNIKNANPKTVEIGLQQVKSFLVAARAKDPSKLSSPTALEGLSAMCKVAQRHDPTYGTQNRILSFTPYEETATASKITRATKKLTNAEQLGFD